MDDVSRYHRALHAMQTGVALLLARQPRIAEPKHVRVGIDSCMVTDAALAALLIAKGVITKDEYMKSLADEAENEVKRLTAELSAPSPGTEVTLI